MYAFLKYHLIEKEHNGATPWLNNMIEKAEKDGKQEIPNLVYLRAYDFSGVDYGVIAFFISPYINNNTTTKRKAR